MKSPKSNKKKSVTAQVINIFILVLIVSVLSGMTFLFVSQLKEEVKDTATRTSVSVANETGFINQSGYLVSNSSLFDFKNFQVFEAINSTGGEVINIANITTSANGYVYNSSAETFSGVNLSYTFDYIAPEQQTAYQAVNKTEQAGYNVTKYLTLLFLALIFGAILIVVLRVMLPYINVSKQMNSGF
jgi:hypothetical protein